MIFKNHSSIWESIADLMTGLMMVFMFVCVGFLYMLNRDTENYEQMHEGIYNKLVEKFPAEKLKEWGAEIDKDLSVRFKNSDVLFELDSSAVKPGYRMILREFFPKFIEVVKEFDEKDDGNNIKEVRIEGHSSPVLGKEISRSDLSYFYNMKLSQDRARNVLQAIFDIPEMQKSENREWLIKMVTANGLSFSKPPKTKNITGAQSGSRNMDDAQRVEFRIIPNAEKVAEKRLGGGKKNGAK